MKFLVSFVLSLKHQTVTLLGCVKSYATDKPNLCNANSTL